MKYSDMVDSVFTWSEWKKKYAVYPRKMDNGQWIWLRPYYTRDRSRVHLGIIIKPRGSRQSTTNIFDVLKS